MVWYDGVRFDNARCLKETRDSILVDCPEFDDPIWIPRNEVHDDSEIWYQGDTGELVITQYIARKLQLCK